MSDRKDVPRLATDDATHPAVRDALFAVKDSVQPSAAALARLQERVASKAAQAAPARGHLRLVRGLGLLGAVAVLLALMLATRTPPVARREPQKAVPVLRPQVASVPDAVPEVAPTAPAKQLPLEPHVEQLPVQAPPSSRIEGELEPRRTRAAWHARALQERRPEPEIPAEVPPVVREEAPHPLPNVELVAPPVQHEPVEQSPRSAPEAESEARLLSRARILLRSDPAATLSLVEEHRARFPAAGLAPERELLAIEALRALGRDREASARERAFRSNFPSAPYVRRREP